MSVITIPTPATGSSTTTEATVTTTGNIDNLNFSNASVLRMNNASDATIRGLVAGVAGQQLTIVSVGAGNVLLAHQDTNSTAANRLINPITSASMPLAAGFGSATYEYDDTTDRWRLVNFDQGLPLTPTFDAADYSASAGTWTLTAGDVNTLKYMIRQSGSMLLAWDLRTTTTSLATGNLERKLPGGFSSAGTQTYTNWYETSGVAGGATREQVSAGLAFSFSVFFNILAGTTFPAETNSIGVRGSAEILIV